MKETKTSKEEMLQWLEEHKRDHELLAFQALKNGGSQRDIQEANHKAKIVSDIIEIVEKSDEQFAHTLYNNTDGYPTRIAFRTREEAEQFAQKNNLKGCRLLSVMYGDQL